MFLLSFDIIDSRKQSTKLGELAELNQLFIRLTKEYKLSRKQMQVHDGDQIRILLVEAKSILKISFDILSFLAMHQLNARVFISNGLVVTNEKLNISETDGPLFYRNRELEQKSKADQNYYRVKHSSIRYVGNSQSDLLDVLFQCLSKLAFKKATNISMIYQYYYLNANQNQLAEKLNITQVAVSSRLKNVNISLIEELLTQIDLLLKLEE